MQERFFILPSSEGLACSVGVGDVRRSWFCSVEMLSAVVVMVLHSLDGMLRCQDRGGLCGLPVRDAS